MPPLVLPLRSVTIALLGLLVLPVAAAATEPGEWQPFDPGPGPVCADGSAVDYLERPADPGKVVLYFEGGGACFSAATCDFDGPDTAYIPSSLATPDWLAERGGVFDFDDERNPLADHSFVYVPYCTGDVHLGDATTTYGDDLTVEHRGYANGLAALDHLVATYPDAAELVVTGISAGAVPTPLFAGLAADRQPEARIVALADGAGAYPDDPVLNAVIGNLWGSAGALPDWPETEGTTVRDWGVPSLFGYAAAHAPDVTFARFDYAYDEAQAFYAELVGVDADDLLELIEKIDAGIAADGASVTRYLAPGSDHTILGSDAFYTLEVQGVPFVGWVGELVEGGRPADVRCSDCR